MKRAVLVGPVWHKVWQWPAVVNLVAGGAACGLFLTCLISGPLGGGGGGSIPAALKWPVPLLVLTGFLAVALETGKPSSGRFLLNHLETSWMSREVLAGLGLVAFSALDAVFPESLFKAAAAMGAIGLMVCQGMMVRASRAVTAWNRGIVPIHFITSGMNLGFGLLLILAPALHFGIPRATLWGGLAFLFANFFVWQHYVFSSDGNELGEATQALRRTGSLAVVVGLGHAFPALLLMGLTLLSPLPSGSAAYQILCLLSGAGIIVGGISQKSGILLQSHLFMGIRAGYRSAR